MRSDARIAGAFGVLAFAAYAATASRFILGGDGGEFASLLIRGGVAHPPGYPLYTLYLHAMRWLPFAEPALRASVATAVFGGLAVMLAYRAARAFGASPIAALLVTVVFAASPLTWRLSSAPEVFALNAAIALAITWLASPNPPVSGTPRAATLALLAGLGLAHQHTIVLVAPIGILGFVQAFREARSKPDAIVASTAALLLGLAPYASLLFAGPSAIHWGDTSTLAALWHHVTRADYGTTSLGAAEADGDAVGQLTLLMRTWTNDFIGLPFVLIAGVVAARVRLFEPSATEDRTFRNARLALLASFVLAGPLFVLLFNIPPRAVGISILERFHLMPAALALVFIAPAFDAVFARRPAAVGFGVVAVIVCVQCARSVIAVRAEHRPTVQRYAENALAIVEPNAIIVGSGDHRAGSFMYAEARGIRRDVDYVQPWLLLSDTHRQAMSERLHVAFTAPQDHVLDVNLTIRELLATGRPLYVTDWPARGVERSFPSYPIGPLIRVVTDPKDILTPPAAYELNQKVFARLVLDDATPPTETWAGSLYADYARSWIVIAGGLKAFGDPRAAECEARGKALLPH